MTLRHGTRLCRYWTSTFQNQNKVSLVHTQPWKTCLKWYTKFFDFFPGTQNICIHLSAGRRTCQTPPNFRPPSRATNARADAGLTAASPPPRWCPSRTTASAVSPACPHKSPRCPWSQVIKGSLTATTECHQVSFLVASSTTTTTTALFCRRAKTTWCLDDVK